LIWSHPSAFLLPERSAQLGRFEIELMNERAVRIVEQTWMYETSVEFHGCVQGVEGLALK
jgi:hypothetical protein